MMSYQVMQIASLKKKIHSGHKVTVYAFIFVTVAIYQARFIEPTNEIDHAMHVHEGKLPDLIILETEEPVDKILKWGKLAAKDHHPIVRESIYWDILNKVCREIKHTKCERKRAWESIDIDSH